MRCCEYSLLIQQRLHYCKTLPFTRFVLLHSNLPSIDNIRQLQSLQKQQQTSMPGGPPTGSPPPQGLALGQGNQQSYGMAPYSPQQVPQSPPQPMGNVFNHLGMQNGGGGGGGGGGSHYGGPIGMGIGQQVAQSVLRGSSPGPIGSGFPGGGNGGYQGINPNLGMPTNGGAPHNQY